MKIVNIKIQMHHIKFWLFMLKHVMQIKGIVHPKMKILSSFQTVFLSSLQF